MVRICLPIQETEQSGSGRLPGGGNGSYSGILALEVPGQRSLAGCRQQGVAESEITRPQ